MWLGKVSVIMYIFSICLTFSGYYVEQVFALGLFTQTTDDLNSLINKNDITDTSVSAELIFGDFITGVRVLFGIMTGATITDALRTLPGISDAWLYGIRILFVTSTAFLWVNLITGRDL